MVDENNIWDLLPGTDVVTQEEDEENQKQEEIETAEVEEIPIIEEVETDADVLLNEEWDNLDGDVVAEQPQEENIVNAYGTTINIKPEKESGESKTWETQEKNYNDGLEKLISNPNITQNEIDTYKANKPQELQINTEAIKRSAPITVSSEDLDIDTRSSRVDFLKSIKRKAIRPEGLTQILESYGKELKISDAVIAEKIQNPNAFINELIGLYKGTENWATEKVAREGAMDIEATTLNREEILNNLEAWNNNEISISTEDLGKYQQEGYVTLNPDFVANVAQYADLDYAKIQAEYKTKYPKKDWEIIEKAKYDTEGITPDLSDEAYNQYITKRIAEDKDGIVVDLQIEAVNEKIRNTPEVQTAIKFEASKLETEFENTIIPSIMENAFAHPDIAPIIKNRNDLLAAINKMEKDLLAWETSPDGEEWASTVEERKQNCINHGIQCEAFWYESPKNVKINDFNRAIQKYNLLIKNTEDNATINGRLNLAQDEITQRWNIRMNEATANNSTVVNAYQTAGLAVNQVYDEAGFRQMLQRKGSNLFQYIDKEKAEGEAAKLVSEYWGAKGFFPSIKGAFKDILSGNWWQRQQGSFASGVIEPFTKSIYDIEEDKLGSKTGMILNQLEVALQQQEFENRNKINQELKKGFEDGVITRDMTINEAAKALGENSELMARTDWNFGFIPSADLMTWNKDDTIGEYYDRKEKRFGKTQIDIKEDKDELLAYEDRLMDFLETDFDDAPITSIEGFFGRVGLVLENFTTMVPQGAAQVSYIVSAGLAMAAPFTGGATALPSWGALKLGLLFESVGAIVEGSQIYASSFMDNLNTKLIEDLGREPTAQEFEEALKSGKYANHLVPMASGSAAAGVSMTSGLIQGWAGRGIAGGLMKRKGIQKILENSFGNFITRKVALPGTAYAVTPYMESLEEEYQSIIEQSGLIYMNLEEGESFRTAFTQKMDWEQVAIEKKMGYQTGQMFAAGGGITVMTLGNRTNYNKTALNIASQIDLSKGSKTFITANLNFENLIKQIKKDNFLTPNQKRTEIQKVSSIRNAGILASGIDGVRGNTKTELVNLFVEQNELKNKIKQNDNKQASVVEIERLAEVDAEIERLVKEGAELEESLQGPTSTMSLWPFGSPDQLKRKAVKTPNVRTADELAEEYLNNPTDFDIEAMSSLLTQYQNIALKALGFDTKAGTIKRDQALSFVGEYFENILRSWDPAQGSLSNWITSNIAPKKAAFYGKEQQLKEKGKETSLSDERAKELQADETQETQGKEFKKRKYPTSIAAIEKQTADARPEILTNIKNSVKQFMASSVGKIKEIGKKGKTAITKLDPSSLAKELKAQNKVTKTAVAAAMGKSVKAKNDFIKKVINDGYIETIPIAAMKKRFKNVKGFNIEKIGRETLGAGTGIYQLSGLQEQALIDFYTKDQSGRRSFIDLLAKGLTIEQFQEVKTDTEFMNDLAFKLKEANSTLTAEEFINEVERIYDGRTKEFASLDKTESLKDKKPVKEITKSKVKKITIQKEGELTKKEKDEVIAKEKRVRDLDEIVPGTKETFGEARDRVVNEFLDQYPQWRSILRSATTHGIDRALFQTAEVFDRAIAKAKQIVKQITLGSKQIISGKKLNLKGLENIETKKFKDQQLKGIDDLIDLYKDFATFLQKNPKSAWVMGEIIADSADSPRSIFRTSASYGFYAIDKNGNRNTTEEGVAEHTKPNMAQQRPLTSAMMEGPAAVETLRPRVKATYMQGFFLKTDDNLVNINNKSTMPEVFYTDVLPAVERGDLDYLVKKYPGIVSWIRPAVAGVNPNFYKSTYNGKTIAEIFGVQVEKKYRNDPNVITAQNAAIIRILKGESKNKVLKDFKTWGKEIGIMQDNAALNTQKEAHTILEKKCSSPCRVPRTSKQVKKTLENSQDTQVNAQKVNKKKKGISVFDLDDTLAKTKEQVLASMPDGTLRRLTPAQFAEQADTLAEQGAEFDFSQFENVKGAKKGPLADLALRRQDKFGSGDIYVLTARPQASAQNIKLFLDGIGLNIPIENITGLEDGSPQAKADWVLSKTQEGYNDFYFADDSKMNVDAVKQILDQVDVKSKVQQAIADKETNLDKEFNEMLEESQGVKSQAEYSKSRAKLEGRKKDKGFFKWLGKQLTITASAEDFLGLMYDLMGRGKQGNRHATWIQDNLIKPYNKAEQSILSAKVTVANDFAALKKSFPSLKSSLLNNPLMDQIGVGPYTKSQAIRVYMWAKQGMEIPGLSKRDQNALVKAVENDVELMSFADNVILIQKDKQYPAPEENWVAGTIDSDLMNSIDTTSRRKEMTEFDENVKIIFSEKNLLKLEAIYGKKWVDALKDSLRRMKSGSNRPVYQGGGSRIVNELLDWLNGSVGAIMFVNMRSGLLQLISNINFINWGDNNIYQAAKAFASEEYWPTVLKLMNSDYLVNRRDGLKINVNEAELANAAKDGGMKGAIAYLLDKGFIITRIMDSLAISTGGATFYINRRNALLKRQNPETGKKYTQAEAEAQAFDDFYAIAEETQQSSNPSKISQQQASLAGRVILSFQNVTMQYNRKVKKSIRNLYNRRKNPGMTQRESDMSNLSQIIYYTTIQNVIFHSLQQTLFALLFDDETEDEEKDRLANIANGMADSLLFGLGFGGAGISTVKNVLLKIMGEHEKKNPKYEEAVWAIFDFSPVLDSKVRKMRTGLKTFSWNMEEIRKRGWSLDNPAYLAIAQMISATSNIPLDRVLRKTMNLRAAMDEETRTWQRVALILGWDTWSLGLPYWGLQSTIAKENKEKAKIKANYKADIRKIKDQGYKKVMSRVLKDYDPKDIIELRSPAGTVVYYAKVREGKKAKN